MKIQTDAPVFGREGVFKSDNALHGTQVEMPYSGIRSFLRRRPTHDLTDVDFAVYGIPFDLTASGRPGARFGPSALREASTQLAWGEVWPWGFDPFDILSVVDCGDVPFRRGQVEKMIGNAYEFAKRIVQADASPIRAGRPTREFRTAEIVIGTRASEIVITPAMPTMMQRAAVHVPCSPSTTSPKRAAWMGSVLEYAVPTAKLRKENR